MTARAMRSAGHRRNPALWVVSNPGLSESAAWRRVSEKALAITAITEIGSYAQKRENIEQLALGIRAIAADMFRQVQAGVHANPGTRRGQKFSDHVQAIVYEHVTEGPRVHGFGNADPDLKTRGDTLSMTGLHERTGAAMYAMPDGSILIRNTNGKPLWREDR